MFTVYEENEYETKEILISEGFEEVPEELIGAEEDNENS